MNTKTLRPWIVVLSALALGACATHRSPEGFAEKFFDKGERYIVKSLKKQDVPDAQLDQARAVLERNRPTVTRDLAGYLRSQREVMRAVTSGRETNALLELETKMHQSHEQALTSIGNMHSELRTTVGDQAWSGATANLEKRTSRYFRE
ncbi:MAG TPA: hypothetical protein VGA00_03120 [Acidiferrobacterales bacterium]